MKLKDGFKSEKMIVVPHAVFSELIKKPYIESSYITDIGFFPNAKYHYRERKEGASTYLIMYCIKGTGTVTVNNKIITLNRNQLVILPKNLPHTYSSDLLEPWSIFWVHFEFKELLNILGQHNISSLIDINSKHGATLTRIFNECITELSYMVNLDSYTYCSSMLHQLIGTIFLSSRENNINRTVKKNDCVELAIEFMNKNIHNTITLADICEVVHFSKPRFINIFKQYTGRSPIDYFILLKLQKSCIDLDYSSKSIKEISNIYAFSDQFYYSRIFKKYIGLSPEKYRIRN